jgi:hypothetical protein
MLCTLDIVESNEEICTNTVLYQDCLRFEPVNQFFRQYPDDNILGIRWASKEATPKNMTTN